MQWLVTFLRALLGIRADIQQKQAEHVGKVVQQNADLKAELAGLQAEDAAARTIPHGKQETIEALKHGDL